MKELDMVYAFRNAVGKGNIKQTNLQRASLVLEELEELETAIKDKDEIEIMDAVCDMVYFALDDMALKGKTFNSDRYKKIDDIIYYSIISSTQIEFQELKDKIILKSSQYSNGDMDCVEYNYTVVVLCMSYAASLNADIHNNTSSYFKAVHMSNMSKFCKSISEADKTVQAYKDGNHPHKSGICVDTYSDKYESLYVIRRKSDDKVMKSINWKNPTFFYNNQ